MKKTLVALAAVSAVSAFAQVTITGYFGGSYDNFGVGAVNASRTGATSESRVSDQSSRIIFGVTEDLGGGLSAIGQFDLRFKVDAAARIQSESNATAGNPTVDPVSSGNQHVGLKKAGLGTLRLGRQDIYYGEAANYLPAGLFLAANPQPLFHSLATANASRTPNLIWLTSDRMNGVEATVGYSTQPLRTSGTNEVESNMGTTTNTGHGGGTFIKFNYADGPLDLTYALIDFKSGYAGGTAYSPNTGAVGADVNANKDQFGQTLVAKYNFNNGFQGSLGYSKEKQVAVATAAAVSSATSVAGLSPALAVGSSITAAAWTASGIYTVGSSNFVVNFA
jgi:predicted porin